MSPVPVVTREPVRLPDTLRLIAWVWVGIGALMAFSGAMAVFAIRVLPQMPEPPADFGPMALIFRYLPQLIALQFGVAVLAVWAGLALLRGRAWARTAIEVLCWLAIAYHLVFAAAWVVGWMSITAPMVESMPEFPAAMRYAGPVIALVTTAGMMVPLGLMVWYLRGPRARAAVALDGR